MGVGTDLEAGAMLALVHVGVHVAHDREADFLGRVLELRHGTDIDHLVDRRGQGDRRSGHAGDPWAPDTTRDDDGVGCDVALVGANAPDVPVDDVDAGDFDARGDRQRTHRLRLLAHQRPGLERVDDADAGRVEAAEDDAFVDERDHLLDLRRGDEADALDAP